MYIYNVSYSVKNYLSHIRNYFISIIVKFLHKFVLKTIKLLLENLSCFPLSIKMYVKIEN